ncbi:outer membrane beta-barrel protein [Corallococcus exiguus]|uniref:outer membrane beta-barrel protein n=1 Tax=Corallococcus exiguus TaxID=83462 RepID=UPI003DA4B053
MTSMNAPFRWTLSLAAALGIATSAGAQEPEPPSEPQTESETSTTTTTPTMSSEETQKSGGHHPEGRIGPQFAVSGNVGFGLGYVYTNGQAPGGGLEDLKITQSAKISFPIIAELGFRVTPRFYLGVWGSWEPVLTKTNELSCPEGFDCSTYQWRVGPEVRYHIRPGASFDPWIGLGVGLEILKSHVEGDTQVQVAPGVFLPTHVDTHVTDRGPTIARLTLGGDVRVTRALAVGPIITASVGQYTVRTGSQTLDITGVGTRDQGLTPVDDGFHALFTLGLRIAFLPL